MSMAVDNTRMDGVSGDGFLRLSKRAPYNSSFLNPGDPTKDLCTSTSSSSSIGNNSDDDDDYDDDDDDDDDDEVQSKFKTSPFDSCVHALEQALPIRRGISNFYNGKSKSFASLTDVACSSLKDITKPENAYTRKRKNLLSYSLLYEKGRAPLPRNPCLRKRSENGPNPETVSGYSSHSHSHSQSPPSLPPWRSFSVADLQHCAVTVKASLPSISLTGKRNKHDEVS